MTFAEYEVSALPDGDPAPYEADTAGGKPPQRALNNADQHLGSVELTNGVTRRPL